MLFPIRRILCPVDLSSLSTEGLKAGVELAGKVGAEVTALHVVSPVPTAIHTPGMGVVFDVPGYQRELSAQKEEELGVIVTGLDSIAGGVKIRLEVRLGATAEVIVMAAEGGGFDMIVMSTSGETGLKRFVMGSVTERVVRLARLPVLCIHPKENKS